MTTPQILAKRKSRGARLRSSVATQALKKGAAVRVMKKKAEPTPQPVAIGPLLAEARDAHARYRAASGRIDTTGKVSQAPHLMTCGDFVRAALKLRTDAHAADPTHADPAWIDDAQQMKGQTNDALIAFYTAYLAP